MKIIPDKNNINFDPHGSNPYLWKFWGVLPLYPYNQRRTVRQEVVKDTIWTFDQIQGVFYVVVPIRMTVIRLAQGGLLVYAPVAPTQECIKLVNELVALHGDVKYIILSTVSGLEHKVFVGPFAREFSRARVFVAPGQWSFPLNLPLSWLGLPGNRTQILPEDPHETPFSDEFDYAILGPINLGLGKFGEVALLHKQSRTLIVTDTIVSVSVDPPAIIQLDPFPLLYHAQEKSGDTVPDNLQNRRKGWRRITLFAFYFRPSAVDVPPWKDIWQDAKNVSQRNLRNYFGFFPFHWKPDWEESYELLTRGGEIFVAPVLRTLILNRAPQVTINWADQVAKWDFAWVIPCHFDAPISVTPQQFRRAFSFLEKGSTDYLPHNTKVEEDLQVLRDIDQGLNNWNIVPPAQDCSEA
ncbi:DUF4336 domain-containing protein [Cylindrospermopsis raciborskii]|uniref:DUF4336 domain-containing protein n=1 Tax=Cylindrospermopsis raciborskii TaxID=77022 RepID=UPI0009A2ED8A|nr:DUF4336 domain-containing protein [Cylindrospermopsis raciborskii]MCZ2201370.1 DUF4336 domain-containing protein [Cylindrospermopsis raciborskii PAMP2012]MCZ2205360.1 DUF4336 domain-containing protein [Cylindrospermopsis raciborskii PAMP2011]NLQ04581.1 DUF4336 domain-containing protein [Cylindrospermopsis raciborskii MVCC19]